MGNLKLEQGEKVVRKGTVKDFHTHVSFSREKILQANNFFGGVSPSGRSVVGGGRVR